MFWSLVGVPLVPVLPLMQLRGLNVCLWKTDFGAGTSSKSTKMAHGGVRYLEKAIFQLSRAQLDLVIEALNERGNMLRTAPHLCTVLPILIPVYNWWQVLISLLVVNV